MICGALTATLPNGNALSAGPMGSMIRRGLAPLPLRGNIMTDRLFAALEAAEISMKNAAEILKVTPPTLFNWRKGTTPKNSHIVNAIEKIAGAIEMAVAKGLLPLNKKEFVRAERLNATRRILVQVLTSGQ